MKQIHSFNLTKAATIFLSYFYLFLKNLCHWKSPRKIRSDFFFVCIIIYFDVHPAALCCAWHWCSCCCPTIAPCEKHSDLGRAEEGIGGNGELNNKSKYLAVESSLELRRTLSASSPAVLNRLSGCWVIVDTEIPALWTRLLFAFACFCSPVEVASVNSPLRQKTTVMPRCCLSAAAGCLFAHTTKKQSNPLQTNQ